MATKRWIFELASGSHDDRAAAMTVEVDDGDDVAWVAFGQDSRLEVRIEGGWRDPRFGSLEEQLSAIGVALVEGRFEEALWFDPAPKPTARLAR